MNNNFTPHLVRMVDLIMIDLAEKQYFLFDMDGTLLDLEQLNYRCFAEQVEAVAGRALSFEEYMKYIAGVGSLQGFENYFSSIGVKVPDLTVVVGLYRERKKYFLENHFSKVVTVKDGAVEFLQRLKELGKKLAVGTSTAKKFALFNLEKAQLKEFFDVIVTVDDVVHSKPAPDIFLEALTRLGGKKSDAVIFEDSVNGVKSAENTGIDFYVLHNPGKNDSVVSVQKNTIRSYTELLKLLD